MKLCLSGLIFTSQKLTWEQHHSFRPADKGMQASTGYLPTEPAERWYSTVQKQQEAKGSFCLHRRQALMRLGHQLLCTRD